MFREAIAKSLKSRIKKDGLQDTAKQMGMSHPALSNFLAGRTQLSQTALERIATRLGKHWKLSAARRR